jgi:glycosyltransferase involved in cell wall biosynthesis
MDKVKVLHILTLIEGRGEYGGPVTVAKTLQEASLSSQYRLRLLGGERNSESSKSRSNSTDCIIRVKPIIKKRQISSLFSINLVTTLTREIHNSQIVHLHFARDLLQIIAGFICILFRKPFFVQTHGMIRKKESLIVSFLDRFTIVPVLKRARTCFVLSEIEEKNLKKVCSNIHIKILRNGIKFANLAENETQLSHDINIVFCSRLHSTKGVRFFCELARHFKSHQRYVFTIFGPDGGELDWVQEFISENKEINLIYAGSLEAGRVLEKLAESDLLVLPSNYDPYPMVILEALSVGTPVLINSECGQSEQIENIHANFVYRGNNSESLIKAFMAMNPEKVNLISRIGLKNSYKDVFGIESVWETLRDFYDES